MIPGISFNDSIQPFKLYRLGYTWHAAATTDLDVVEDPPKIERPVLMELIDVTLPRRNTIEAVAVWEQLEAGILGVTPVSVAVQPNPPAILAAVSLPMPGIFYHLVEISTMLCEIADGSSRHPDKLPKRFDRFKKIMEMPELDQQRATAGLSALVGVPNITQVQPGQNGQVTNAIATYASAYLSSTDSNILLARKIMDIVANRQPAPIDPRVVLQERAKLSDFLESLAQTAAGYIVSAAYSDDLVLLEFFNASKYIRTDLVKTSGLASCVAFRVTRYADLTEIGRALQEQLQSQESVTVRSRQHNTVRPHGITSECTLVAFVNGRADICITLTNATLEEAPFHLAPVGQRTSKDTMYCAPAELASQRKVVAALIDDYSVRTAIANQYEILKELLPDI